MRSRPIVAIVLAFCLLLPVQGTGASSMQDEQPPDPKQPNENSSTMYLYHDGYAEAWTHFANNDTMSTADGEYREEKDNGVIDIKLRFIMKPELVPRLNLTVGGEARGTLRLDLGGDWENGGDGNCNNDCENMNITIYHGPNIIHKQQLTGLQEGNQSYPFMFTIPEDHAVWDGRDDNPVIEITMKLKGDRSNVGPGGILVQGTPAHFALILGMESRLDLPIDPETWTDSFQAGEDGLKEPEDTPGFTFVAGAAALSMAFFYNVRREEETSLDE
ncbi:MAG: hypothetical protein VW230_07510 [Candidatus Poseidoniales archaeon]|jgi:hypothetical protein